MVSTQHSMCNCESSILEGVMRIILAMMLIVGAAHAVPVDPNSPDGIAAFYNAAVLSTYGLVYNYDNGSDSWLPWGEDDPLPVSVSEIRDWWWHSFRTYDNRFFMFDGDWVEVPFPPIEGPIQSESETLGSVKQMFR